MREILFKAKTTVNEVGEFNNVWVEGDLITSNGKYYIHPKNNAVSVSGESGKIIVMHEVDPNTLSQYTGLCDKNGKKIFENDIVTSGSDSTGRKYYSAVYYDEFNCSCCNGVYGWTFSEGYGDIREYKEYEVVGNIFDNADLLKETVVEDEEPSEYVEQDTRCDLCKYNGECESKIEITTRRDTRAHYIRWFNEYCKLESEESDGTAKI